MAVVLCDDGTYAVDVKSLGMGFRLCQNLTSEPLARVVSWACESIVSSPYCDSIPMVEMLELLDREIVAKLEVCTGHTLNSDYLASCITPDLNRDTDRMAFARFREFTKAAGFPWKRYESSQCNPSLSDYPSVPDAFGMVASVNPPESPGIYFLWSKGQVAYVGKSKNIFNRVCWKHHAIQRGDSVSWVEIPIYELDFAECYYIALCRPSRNFNSKYRESKQAA